MIIQRWQAPVFPSQEQVHSLLEMEGLEPFIEEFGANHEVSDHKHPFEEIRIVFSGELMMNVAGNQLLLRPGDRIEIPANTKHSIKSQGAEQCVCICARRC